MGIINFIKTGLGELAIARPDDKKGLLVYKHPDPTIPNKAQLTVGMDEVALFFKDGQFVGQIGPGRHTLQTDNIVFLNNLIDKVTGGNVFQAQIWFVTTREVAGFKFGGRIGDLEDPKTNLAVQTMVHGEFSLQANDPVKVIQFFGQRSYASDEEFSDWFRQQVLKVMRGGIASLIVKKKIPLLDVTSSSMNDEIDQAVIETVQPLINSYGFKVVRLGNFVISIKEEDELTLKNLYKDAAQIKMAGGNLGAYQQYAAAKAMMGAGEGMAKGGGDGSPVLAGAGLGVGMAMANMFNQQSSQASSQQPSAPSLEERLKKLKALKEQGLIDEQEYAAKRAELLKEV